MSRRNFGLDLLRSVAILMVLFGHGLQTLFIGVGLLPHEGVVAAAAIAMIPSVEWLFLLSGFLIGAMYIRMHDQPGAFWPRTFRFWVRRWFRTIPNYYLFLLVNLALVSVAIAPGVPSWSYAAFSQNLAWREHGFYQESWSLALDEWFYLLLPLLAFLFARLARRPLRDQVFMAAGVLILVPLIARIALPPATSLDQWHHSVRRMTLLHLDATGWGVLAAATNRWFPVFWARSRGAKAAMGAVCMAIGLVAIETLWFRGSALDKVPQIASGWSLSLIGAGSFLAFPWLTAISLRIRLARPVAFLSNVSYSVYLAHFPMLYLLLWMRIPTSRWEATALSIIWLAATLAVSFLVYRGFEKPVSDIRERWAQRVDANPF